MAKPEPLTFGAFRQLIADWLSLDVAQVTPEAYFITDLGVDSIRMIDVLLRLDEMGVRVSPDLAWKIQTVEEAYCYYQEQAGEVA